MTLREQIRAVLNMASGPMTAREIREQLEGDHKAENVGAVLVGMRKDGEVDQDRTDGKFTYLIVPGWKPKRERPAEPKAEATEPVNLERRRSRSFTASDHMLLVNFAMHAPVDVPEWFTCDPTRPPPTATLGSAVAQVRERERWADEQSEARFFAWRWHYAQQMVAAAPF